MKFLLYGYSTACRSISNMDLNKYLRCITLNVQALALLLKGRILNSRDVAHSYNNIARHYDRAWLDQLKDTTDIFLGRLPAPRSQLPILDLGCGTGYTTLKLAALFPEHPVKAVDSSSGMLACAAEKINSGQVEFIQNDMLDFLHMQRDNSASMIVSGWAIGYSNPEQIIKEARRVLSQKGIFAFIVNYRDTLAPIFLAFRKTMAHFPEALKKVAFPKFPKNYNTVENNLKKSHFCIHFHKDGRQTIEPKNQGETIGDWILSTGILAGFDSMLPFNEDRQIKDFFTQQLKNEPATFFHHYMIVIAEKT